MHSFCVDPCLLNPCQHDTKCSQVVSYTECVKCFHSGKVELECTIDTMKNCIPNENQDLYV